MHRSILFVIAFVVSVNAHALTFSKACEPGESLMIGAVGDVLLHGPLQKQGYKSGFESLWKGIQPFMEGPDIMYANLEGPAANGVGKGGKSVKDPGPVFDGVVYSGYPLFNYHSSIVEDLKASGVDIVSTANNHALDRGALGARKTIEALDFFKLPFMGTVNLPGEDFFHITQNGSWKVAWVACTYGTNGITDKEGLVLTCFDGRVTQLIKALKPQVDAVIITPHWGAEYSLTAGSEQKSFARQWLEEGATAIIGSHPHVPQTWEKYTTKDKREGLILYSLGNFVSNQTSTAKQSSLVLFLGLTKKGGQTWVNGVRYLPLFMSRAGHLEVIASNAVATPNSEHKASLKLVKDMYGAERIITPGQDVVTNLECEK